MKKLLLLFILTQISCASVGNNMVNHAFLDDSNEAEKLIKSGKYNEAIDDLTTLLAMDQKNEKVLFLRGVAYQKMERFPEAINDYKAVLKINPDHLQAHNNLGMMYAFKLAEPKLALQEFDTFLSLDPKNAQAFSIAKIMCSIDGSDHDDSVEETLRQDYLGNVMAQTDPNEKKKLLLEGIKKYPNDPLFYYLTGQVYENDGKIQDAISYYEQALDKRITCAPCHKGLSRMLMQKKQTRQAQIHELKAELFDPANN